MPHRLTKDGRATLHVGDARAVLAGMPDGCMSSCVTDPPYAFDSIVRRFGSATAAPARGGHADGAFERTSARFAGQAWDTEETAFDPVFWGEVRRVLRPGAHLVAFCSTKKHHRLACAIEDAGFEIRDMLAWIYSTALPRSHPVRDDGWEGWRSALKVAQEPIVLARVPMFGPMTANVRTHGTGALNVDACRHEDGRFPCNVLQDGSLVEPYARHFYSAKANAEDRAGSEHPTVKPVALMRWLCRLVTPPGGRVLDPFAGSGTTGQAAVAEGFEIDLVERDATFARDVVKRFIGIARAAEALTP